jgi:hypothetical protein
MSETIEQRLERHRAFWKKQAVDRPLLGFRIGEYLFARDFQAAKNVLHDGKIIHPDMLDVDAFLKDHERMYAQTLKIGQDAFWTPSPFTGVPWMEAMLGCEIRGSAQSMTSEPWMDSLHVPEELSLDGNPWFEKYAEFLEKFSAASQGRFPVGQPIMRGASDMLGALRGQTNLVFDFADNPQRIRTLSHAVTDLFLQVIERQHTLTKPFYGGSAMGFYHLWCPGPCIWTQEDLSALMSPRLYRKFLLELDCKIFEGYDYTLFHMHPSSFFILDDLLSIEALKVIQINKDVGGPPIKDMLGVFQKVLDTKRLVIWGDLTQDDLEIILRELPYEGLYLHIVTETPEEAKCRMQYVKQKAKGLSL